MQNIILTYVRIAAYQLEFVKLKYELQVINGLFLHSRRKDGCYHAGIICCRDRTSDCEEVSGDSG